MDHLTSAQINDLRAGGLDAEARQHLHDCEMCRSRLFGERLLDLLLTQVQIKERGAIESPHPSIESRLHYAEGDLDAVTATEMDAHFSNCEECTSWLLSVQSPAADTLLLEPPRALMEKVRSQFISAPTPVSLGQLFLEALNRVTVRLTFRPALGHHGFAPPLSQDLFAAESSHSYRAGKPTASAPVELTVGMIRIALFGVQTTGQIALTITASNAVTGEGQPDLAVSLLPATGVLEETSTNAQGQATFTLRSERAKLQFGTTPASEIELHLVQEP